MGTYDGLLPSDTDNRQLVIHNDVQVGYFRTVSGERDGRWVTFDEGEPLDRPG